MNSNTYYIYVHIYIGPLFPWPMFYVGQAKGSPYERWGINGSGYDEQPFGKALKANHIKWEELIHLIIKEGLSAKEADELECYYIDRFNSLVCNGHGWNKYYGKKSMKTGIAVELPEMDSELSSEIWSYIENKIKNRRGNKCNFVFDSSTFKVDTSILKKAVMDIADINIPIIINSERQNIKPYTVKILSSGKLWLEINPCLILNY